MPHDNNPPAAAAVDAFGDYERMCSDSRHEHARSNIVNPPRAPEEPRWDPEDELPYELQLIDELQEEIGAEEWRQQECAAGRRAPDHEQAANNSAYQRSVLTQIRRLVRDLLNDKERLAVQLNAAQLRLADLKTDRSKALDEAHHNFQLFYSKQIDLKLERDRVAELERQLADAAREAAAYRKAWRAANPRDPNDEEV